MSQLGLLQHLLCEAFLVVFGCQFASNGIVVDLFSNEFLDNPGGKDLLGNEHSSSGGDEVGCISHGSHVILNRRPFEDLQEINENSVRSLTC